MPPRSAMRSWPSASAIRPAAMNMAALAKACEKSCKPTAGPGDVAPGLDRVRADEEREHQEQIADLRHRRVGDQELQPRLPQRKHAAEHDCRGAHRAEHLRCRNAAQAGHAHRTRSGRSGR